MILLLVPSQTGCGTMCNLHAPPPAEGDSVGRGNCMPFGGFGRSMTMSAGVPIGIYMICDSEVRLVRGEDPEEKLKTIGLCTLMTGAGLVAIADVPVSLAGDIVTLPLAQARLHREPWATWWGDQAKKRRVADPEPSADQADAQLRQPSPALGSARAVYPGTESPESPAAGPPCRQLADPLRILEKLNVP
jgi:hypothetical protein